MKQVHLIPQHDTGCQHTTSKECPCNPNPEPFIAHVLELVKHNMVGEGADLWNFVSGEEVTDEQ